MKLIGMLLFLGACTRQPLAYQPVPAAASEALCLPVNGATCWRKGDELLISCVADNGGKCGAFQWRSAGLFWQLVTVPGDELVGVVFQSYSDGAWRAVASDVSGLGSFSTQWRAMQAVEKAAVRR